MAPLLDLLHNLKTNFLKQVNSSIGIPRIIHATVLRRIEGKGEDEDEDEVRVMFEAWMIKYHKSYNSLAEKETRFQIFKDCHTDIEKKNLERAPGRKEGRNEFSDLTLEENMLWLTGWVVVLEYALAVSKEQVLF